MNEREAVAQRFNQDLFFGGGLAVSAVLVHFFNVWWGLLLLGIFYVAHGTYRYVTTMRADS